MINILSTEEGKKEARNWMKSDLPSPLLRWIDCDVCGVDPPSQKWVAWVSAFVWDGHATSEIFSDDGGNGSFHDFQIHEGWVVTAVTGNTRKEAREKMEALIRDCDVELEDPCNKRHELRRLVRQGD